MKPTLPLLILLCYFLNFQIGYAQKTPDFSCGFDELLKSTKETGNQSFEDQLRLHLSNRQHADNGSGTPYIIPVVVHIIHDGGPENIPDAQIIAAIDHLNEGFAAQGYFAQQGATVNSQIQFCMAKRDPNGNATNGITRTQSPLTNMVMETEDIQTKDLSRWNPLDYVNIWVVKEISSLSLGPGVAGYAYFPSAHGGPEDGMICEAKFFGTDPSEDAVLIHEMGHYFGLYHTFQGGCQNNDCSLDGDRVCDTPPDNATHTTCPFNSCSTDVAPGSPFLSDVDDFTGDFMDYSPFPCYHFFTAEQAIRMQATVETARASLLDSKGCLDPCTQPIVAAFSATPNPVLAGQTVTFTNNSTGATNFSWSENGLEFSQNLNASRTFNSVGTFPIVLTANNNDPNCKDTSVVNIVVECALDALFSSANSSALVGETVLFTNLTTGAAPITYEWSINGQLVSTTQDLSFSFINAGIYSISLQATGLFCSKEYNTVFTVNKHCGQTESISTSYTSTIKSFYTQDLATIPDGTLLHCGVQQLRPAVTRWDASGNVIWHKVTTDNGGFFDLEPLPDGQFLLTGQAANKFLVAKIDVDGNFSWYKKLSFTTNNFPNGDATDVCAANPDGSLGLFVLDGLNAYLLKIAANGTVLWAKRLNNVLGIGGLRVATDGTGDFLLSTTGSFGSTTSGITVMRINQAGQFVKAVKYAFPGENFQGHTYEDLSVHPEDGGYSLFFTGFVPNGNTVGHKRLVHCAPDGSVLWAKRFETSGGLFSMYALFRHLPDQKGWLVSDYKSNANHISQGNYLMHISNDGEPLWQRRYDTGGLFDNCIVAAELQNGLVKAVWEAANNSELRLFNLPDSDMPLACFPDVPLTDVTFPMTVLTENVVVTSSNVTVSLDDTPLVLANDVLTATPLCAAILPCPEICANELDDDEDGYVDCFDTDCDCFDADTSCLVDPPVNNFSAKLDWESTINDVSVAAVPIVANLNPQQDSIPEILVFPSSTTANTVGVFSLLIFKGDGSNASNPNALVIPEGYDSYPAGNATVVDLDKNGIPEVIMVTMDAKIKVYTDFNPAANPCMKQWVVSTQNAFSGNTRAYVADFDGDGIAEIFVGNDVFKLDLTNPAVPLLTRILDGNGPSGMLVAYGQIESPTAADLLSRADCNGDPDCDGLEIAAGFQIFSIDMDLADGDGFEIKVQRNLNVLNPNHTVRDGYTCVADLNLDGVPEIIVSGRRDNQPGIYVWNKNGFVQAFNTPSITNMYGMVCIANVFDDKTAGFAQDFPELIVTQMGRIFCFNVQKAQSTPFIPEWWSLLVSDGSGLTGVSSFDFNGDGLLEIVYRDEQNLRIMYGGAAPFPLGVDSERNWYKTLAGSGTYDEYPVVADVDNDGEAEIAVTSFTFGGVNNPWSDFRGRLRVYESDNGKWMPARPLWNQFNYFGLNINDDVSAPKTQQKHWLEMGGIGSGKRPFNTHLAQTSTLFTLPSNKIKVPDAIVEIDSTHCQSDSFTLFLNLCNLGSAQLPSGTPISFYNGDPTATSALLLFPPILINEALEVGACTDIKLSIPAFYNTTIYAVINDDGTVPSPFNLTANFPSTNQQECRYENNMVSFSFQNQTQTLDLGPDISLCKNSVVELSANPNFQKYRWQDGSTGSTFTAYSAGKYWVDVFDACGFQQTDTINIVLNSIAALDLPDELIACEGESINLTASGFATYTWAPADSVSCSNCASVNILATKSITIQLTAADGDCFVSDSVLVKINPKPIVQLLAIDGDCDTPASIVPNVMGEGPFEFLWSNLATDSVINIAQSGTYTVEITDNNGCQTIDSVAVTNTNSLAILVITADPLCANSQTGSINLTVNGGTGPFQYLWSNNATTEDLSNLAAGTYTVIATDSNGCTSMISETLTSPPPIVLGLQSTDPKCAGESSGAIDLTASGGTGNLTFTWSTNSSLEDLNNLPSGTYSVLTTDANGCTATIAETLTEPQGIVLGLQGTDPKCAGEASGAIDLTASGGTGNLSFIWSNNSSLEDLNNLPSGTYSVLTTDVNGCTATISETLTDPQAIVLGLQSTDPKCAGESSGAINLTSSGGIGNLTFSWSNGSSLEDLNNLPSGTYSVLTTDANGCTATISEILTDPQAIVLGLQSTDPKCAGEASGAIDLTASGGTGNLTFSWSNNSSQEDLNNLPSGTYSVLTTDANGCTATLAEILTDPPAMLLGLQKSDLNCPGDSALVDLSVSNGTAPFTFSWSTGETTEDIFVSQAGNYTATVFDSNGCETSETTSISILGTVPMLQLTTDTLTCQQTTGVISVSSSLPNTSFLWSGSNGFSSTLSAPTISQAGIYTVSATDPLGACTAIGSITVPIDTSAPVVSLASDLMEIPCDQTTITISALGSSNGPDFSIQWTATNGGTILSGGNTLFPIVGSAGLYDILISDLTNGCSASKSVEVVQSEALTGIATADSVRCFGETNGIVRVVLSSGGTAPFMYSIDNQNFKAEPVFENLAADIYQVYVVDANGCEFSTSIEVGQPRQIAVDLTGDSLVLLGELANLQAIVSPPNFVPAQIEWTANGIDLVNNQLELSMQLLENTIFQIEISDEHGCSASEELLVRVDQGHKIYVPNVIFPGSPGGTNQTFLIYTDSKVLQIESLNIFDRWGSHVFTNQHFQPNDESQGWDGTFRGKPVAPGVYVWVAKIAFKDGTETVLKGDLTVLR